MKTKVSMKTIYLIMVISVGLIGLALGSTYAVFTATAEINNPISIVSNLSYTSDIIETKKITVAPNTTEYFIFDISNETSMPLNYVIWYLDEGYDIDFGFESGQGVCGTTCAEFPSGYNESVGITILNKESRPVTVTVGIASSTTDIVLPNNMKVVPEQVIPSYNVIVSRNDVAFKTESVFRGLDTTISVTGTSENPIYTYTTCSDSQVPIVTETNENGIDTAYIKLNSIMSNTSCNATFVPSGTTFTVEIYVTDNLEYSGSGVVKNKFVVSDIYVGPATKVECTNNQEATLENVSGTGTVTIDSLTNNTVCNIT